MKTRADIYAKNIMNTTGIGFVYGMQIFGVRILASGIELHFKDGKELVEPCTEVNVLTIKQAYEEKGIDLTGRYEATLNEEMR